MSSKWSKGTSGPAGDEVANLIPVAISQCDSEGITQRDIDLVRESHPRDEECEVEVDGSLSAEPGMKQQTYLAIALRDDVTLKHQEGVAFTLTQPSPSGGGHPQAIAIRTANTNENGHGVSEEVAHTIDQAQGQAIAFESRFARNGRGAPSDVVPPLKAQSGESGKGDAAPLVAITAPSLTATNDPSRSPQSSEVTQQVAAVHGATMQVRRLTPRECERLQGFPDDYTLITVRGKPAADGPRYRALGNSMAVNVMRWIGGRIDAAKE